MGNFFHASQQTWALNTRTCQSFLKGMDGKYHHIPILDLEKSFLQLSLCKEVVPIWGIITIQAALQLIPLRLPRLAMRVAFYELQLENMKHQWLIILRVIFFTKPMHIWHTNCKCKTQPYSHDCCFIFQSNFSFFVYIFIFNPKIQTLEIQLLIKA